MRTNLLWDAAAEPNLGVEFPVGKHVSLGVNAGIKTWPRWLFWDNDNVQNTSHWRNFAVVPEARYYFDQVYDGFFVGADALYTHFNVGNVKFPLGLYPEVQENRVQGSYWAGGLFTGYSWWLGQHIRLEVEAGAAIGLAAYDRFACAHCGTKLAEVRRAAVVPKVGLNIAWNPVARDKRQVYDRQIVNRTDTLTVMTPPVAFVVHTKEVAEPESAGDRLSKEFSWVMPIDKYRPFDYLTSPGRDSIEFVHYRLNSSVLEPELSDNAEHLERVEKVVTAIKEGERTDEIFITIVGLASIEGKVEHNDSLSSRRARALANYLISNTGVERRSFEIIGKGEAWDWFCAQAEAASDREMLDIINSEKDLDKREKLIKSNADLYGRIKRDYLEDQRNAGYLRVYYGDAPDPTTAKFNGPVAALIKAKKYAAAVREIEGDKTVLSRVKTDAEAMNAYAVALYFTALDNKDADAEARALKMLETASRMGSESARANLEGAKIYGPARKEYEAWKKVMSE